MNDDELVRFLRIPLYNLLYIDDIGSFDGYNVNEILKIKNSYTNNEISNIVSALKWGVSNPEYDFSSLLPGLKHQNKLIYRYICIVASQFEQIL